MGKQIDLVVGAIYDMNDDRQAGWSAYFAADSDRERLIDEIVDLKAEIKRLKEKLNGRKKQGKL
jgi:hypothetical protein